MTLSARVIGVRSVAAGEGVGYGHTFVTRRATRLALVPVGYADGLPRIAGPHARMLVGGGLAPVVGRISMDQAILDVGDRSVRTATGHGLRRRDRWCAHGPGLGDMVRDDPPRGADGHRRPGRAPVRRRRPMTAPR